MSEADWLTSRCIGFLVGAINRIVAQDNLEEEGVFAVQLGVWEDLTCAAPSLFATRLYLLSSEGDIDIREGHIAGAFFADALLSGDEEVARTAWDASLGDLGSAR
ncbi:hypothetical protein HTT03_09745 [Sulfitobacter sp. S0837]|uniref:hypothetical protein n=1 Tax=Sulfitobacter maritimus TaxID=2741719 RepID=UPI001581B1A7|nr:hypothetical protein [Sulfitobacter maritimus]NUH63718.1 hypothetical protein [Sulfitobacter maritimus]NUH63808.1 hypothetical protein [Sulfitobacter maritimus]NUH65565.1 hypothetical protein [Sulfitobacter maritimus]